MAPSSVLSQVSWSPAIAAAPETAGCASSSRPVSDASRCTIVSSSGRSNNLGGCLSSCSGSRVAKRQFFGKAVKFVQPGEISLVRKGFVVEAAKRIQTGRSYVLSSTLHIAEGKEEEVAALCRGILRWAEEKKSAKGSGIAVFECNVDPFEKNVLHFWEQYASFQIMNDTRASPEHTKFINEVRPFLTGPIGLAAYEYKDGQIGHMMNPIGPKGEGGLDDATGQAGTKQQSSSIGQGLVEMEEDDKVKSWGLDKLLAKVRGEDKEAGWSFKTLFGDVKK
ncbi:hypothetical protein R1sor_005015 [Riccia sorocarpa]|uniref:ABM domain-containing protein n=1 Tax=Riccia sorocarpa TaxID=122646 RepID=A0ABD3HLV1_9MARC